jgi:Glycosyl transferase family 11
MIIVKLNGGLGNQMFQYAAGRCLAEKYATDLYIDTSFLDKNTDDTFTRRNLELNVFNIPLQIASKDIIKKFNIEHNNKISRHLQRHFPILFKYLYAAESGMQYHPAFTQYPKNTYLEGFWQSEKYFINIKDILFNTFTIKTSMNDENKKWLAKISSSTSVSLHIRRGDYISNKNALKFHGLLKMDYYLQAISQIKEKEKAIELFVFSDDLAWCQSHLNLNEKIHFVDVNSKKDFHFDLFLMSQCKHNIIANSSFSWWGAWLNQHKDKIVIAPKKWLADTRVNTKDIIPNTWIQI